MFNQVENGVICYFFGHTEIVGVLHQDYLLDINGIYHVNGDKLEVQEDKYIVSMSCDNEPVEYRRNFAGLVEALEQLTTSES